MSGDLSRERYRPSGRFNPFALAAWGLVGLAAAVGMGVLLYLAYVVGFYLIFFAPLVAGLVVAGVVYLAVRQAHCRNRVVAGALGVVVGAVLYLSYYHAGLVDAIGLHNAHRVDVLPLYIQARMHTDVVQDVGAKPPAAQANDPGRVVMNWILFGLELATVVALVTAAAVSRAGYPYSETGGRWMTETTAIFPPGTGGDLAAALETGSAELWVNGTPERTGPKMPYSSVALHYDPAAAPEEEGDAPVFLTVKETQCVQQGFVLKKSMPKIETLLSRVRLTPDEVRALLPVFPSLKAVAPAPPAAAAPRPVTYVPGRAVARVEPVPEPYADQVLTAGHARRGLLRVIGFLALIAAGPILLIAALVVGLSGVGLGPLRSPALAGLCFLAGIGCLASVIKVGRAIQRGTARSLYRAACRHFRARPDLLVDPDDPEAIFVDMVPRRNWARANRMLETAGDVGFLRIDAERGLLLFEGDHERYQVPATAILGCEVEQVEPPNSYTTQTDDYPHFMAVVRANRPDGPWEAPLAVRHDAREAFAGRSHQARAHELRERILALLPPGPDTQAPDAGL